MKSNEMMKWVLENEIARKQCLECLGIWFKVWVSDDNMGYYRLSPVAPIDCSVCLPLDEELESSSVYSVEGWFET